MNLSRPVPWVSPVVYAAVLIAGLRGGTHLPLFLAGMAGLFALEFVRHDLLGLIAKTALFVVVAYADGSGLSRAMFVLVPFTAYFAFGRLVSVALGGAILMVLVVSGVDMADILMFAIGLVLAVAMASAVVELRQSQRQIAELSATAERQRVARDLHDDLGHHLTAAIVQLEKAQAYRELDPAAADRALADATESARRALADVRKSVHALRSYDFADLGIPVRISGDASRYSAGALAALYHAAQEGITNARRHADAGEVNVRVHFDRRQARLTVTDDGRGIGHAREGFGLRSMRERVQQVGGKVRVESSPGSGTSLTVTIPRA